jgi:hypothetical protein
MKNLIRYLGVSVVVLGLAPALAHGGAISADDAAAFVNAPPRDDGDSVDGQDPPPADGVTDPVEDPPPCA